MTEPLTVGSRLSIPEGELSWRFSRSSGPGGQSVNTTDSRGWAVVRRCSVAVSWSNRQGESG